MSERGIPTPPGYDPPNRPKQFAFPDVVAGGTGISLCANCKAELHGTYSGAWYKDKMVYFCNNSCEAEYFDKPKEINLVCKVINGTTGH